MTNTEIVEVTLKPKRLINISFWGKYWGQKHGIEDYLWSDSVEKLPDIGSTLSIIGDLYQVTNISIDDVAMLLDREKRYLIEVIDYEGPIAPTLIYGVE